MDKRLLDELVGGSERDPEKTAEIADEVEDFNRTMNQTSARAHEEELLKRYGDPDSPEDMSVQLQRVRLAELVHKVDGVDSAKVQVLAHNLANSLPAKTARDISKALNYDDQRDEIKDKMKKRIKEELDGKFDEFVRDVTANLNEYLSRQDDGVLPVLKVNNLKWLRYQPSAPESDGILGGREIATLMEAAVDEILVAGQKKAYEELKRAFEKIAFQMADNAKLDAIFRPTAMNISAGELDKIIDQLF